MATLEGEPNQNSELDKACRELLVAIQREDLAAQSADGSSVGPDTWRFMVTRIGGVEISIRPKEGPHHRPHFHVWASGVSASIAIDNLDLLEGKWTPVTRRAVREWAPNHKGLLGRLWDESRPTHGKAGDVSAPTTPKG
jgi:Domain of unknown function (DUF4160)